MRMTTRKPLWIEIPTLLAISLVLALTVNVFRSEGLAWVADKAAMALEETGPDGRLGVSIPTALAAWKKGGVVFVDVRSEKHYRIGHVAGAVNVPLDDAYSNKSVLSDKLPDKNGLYILYCSDEECAMSEIVAEMLKDLGYANVAEMPAGIKGWKKAGGKVEVSK